jgi:hypothetical protein
MTVCTYGSILITVEFITEFSFTFNSTWNVKVVLALIPSVMLLEINMDCALFLLAVSISAYIYYYHCGVVT